TEGKPVVTDIITCAIGETELLQLAGSLEKQSEHPLAYAIVTECVARQIEFQSVDNYRAVPGGGIIGEIAGQTYFVGNYHMLQEQNISLGDWQQTVDNLAALGKTNLYFGSAGQLLGILTVADVVKPQSQQAIWELQNKLGVDVCLLTGDNAITAKSIARQVGIKEVIAEVLPAEKELAVRQLQSHSARVAMVGVFISVLGWKLNPMFAAAAMSCSSLCVVTNALRLRNFKPGFTEHTKTKADILPANAVNVQIGVNALIGGEKMVKTMHIEGMSCSHCS
ncbi:MAG: HAD-IC family P-type ATPase, partial [Firmicutes bacterium]|nr:HAD-IC family P-type ATPase [Bacillota bacterium]